MTRNQFKKMIKETWEQEAKDICKNIEEDDSEYIDEIVRYSYKEENKSSK